VGVTGGCLDVEDTLLDGQEGHIEGTSKMRTLHSPMIFLSRP
jgi:hypothetical protein